MSAAVVESESDAMMLCCASCGIAGGDDMKLKKCTACHLVKYCSVKCQKDHRPQHKRECKKRAAELRDEILFKQPESSHFGDCPICCLPLPIDKSKSSMFSCCSKFICNGCVHANNKREYEGRLQPSCPFCREATPSTCEKINEQWIKRIEANDPVAICDMGTKKYHEKDYKNAYEHWTRAIALGDVEAHYQLSCLYRDGLGVEKDMKKRVYHLEQAAIGGYLMARHNLGCVELDNGQHDRAVKHWIIAAKLGFEPSLENVKNSYTYGHVSKDDLAAALRGHQAAIDATKSPQREEAVKFAAGV